MQTVLITAIGSVSADVTIKSLHKNGCRVIGTDIYPRKWLVNSSSVDCFVQVPRISGSKAYIDMLLDICKRESVEYIIPLTDLEIDVLNEHRTLFEQNEITLCFSGSQAVNICRDKRAAAALIESETDCRVIPEISFDMLPDWKRFPVVCKRLHGRSSVGMHVLSSAEEISCFLQTDAGKYVIQPFIDGDIITVDVLRDKTHNRHAVTARKELLRTVNGLGTAVQVFHRPQLTELCVEMANALDVEGCVNFEFIETENGELYFLECNPRFSGGVKFSVMSGYDFVINHLRYFQGIEIETQAKPPIEQTIVRKYEEFVT